VLGGALADVGPGDELLALACLLGGRGLRRGGRFLLWLGLGGRSRSGPFLALLQKRKHVLLADAAAGAGALDLGEVQVVLVGEAPDERRDHASLGGVPAFRGRNGLLS
jgi:hypothetical protein